MVSFAAAFCAGCGGSTSSSASSLEAILKRPGPDVAVTAGASDFVPGAVRYPFLVIRNDARPVERGTAGVWVAAGRESKPFAHVTAMLEPIGIPGRSAPAFGEVSRIYIAHLRVPRPGRYWVVAEPAGAKIQAIGTLEVVARSSSPAVGAKAPRSATPTLADESAASLTTRRPPDFAISGFSGASTTRRGRRFRCSSWR